MLLHSGKDLVRRSIHGYENIEKFGSTPKVVEKVPEL